MFIILESGILLCEVSIFLSFGADLLLYKRLYRKNGLSKWCIFLAIPVGAGAFLIYWYGLTVNV